MIGVKSLQFRAILHFLNLFGWWANWTSKNAERPSFYLHPVQLYISTQRVDEKPVGFNHPGGSSKQATLVVKLGKLIIYSMEYESSWWLNQPIWKNICLIGSFPEVGLKRQYLKPPIWKCIKHYKTTVSNAKSPYQVPNLDLLPLPFQRAGYLPVSASVWKKTWVKFWYPLEV